MMTVTALIEELTELIRHEPAAANYKVELIGHEGPDDAKHVGLNSTGMYVAIVTESRDDASLWGNDRIPSWRDAPRVARERERAMIMGITRVPAHMPTRVPILKHEMVAALDMTPIGSAVDPNHHVLKHAISKMGIKELAPPGSYREAIEKAHGLFEQLVPNPNYKPSYKINECPNCGGKVDMKDRIAVRAHECPDEDGPSEQEILGNVGDR